MSCRWKLTQASLINNAYLEVCQYFKRWSFTVRRRSSFKHQTWMGRQRRVSFTLSSRCHRNLLFLPLHSSACD